MADKSRRIDTDCLPPTEDSFEITYGECPEFMNVGTECKFFISWNKLFSLLLSVPNEFYNDMDITNEVESHQIVKVVSCAAAQVSCRLFHTCVLLLRM